MAREFKKMYFDGSGEHSAKACARLHALLDEGLSELSGIQQPPRPCSEDKNYSKKHKSIYAKAEKRISDIAKDLFCALTGKEILEPSIKVKAGRYGVSEGYQMASTVVGPPPKYFTPYQLSRAYDMIHLSSKAGLDQTYFFNHLPKRMRDEMGYSNWQYTEE